MQVAQPVVQETPTVGPHLQAMQVAPSRGQIYNQCTQRHQVAKIGTSTSYTIWWLNLEPIQVTPPSNVRKNYKKLCLFQLFSSIDWFLKTCFIQTSGLHNFKTHLLKREKLTIQQFNHWVPLKIKKTWLMDPNLIISILLFVGGVNKRNMPKYKHTNPNSRCVAIQNTKNIKKRNM